MKKNLTQIYKSWCYFIYAMRSIEHKGDLYTFYDGVMMTIEDAMVLSADYRRVLKGNITQ